MDILNGSVAGCITVALVHSSILGLVYNLRHIRNNACLREGSQANQDWHVGQHKVVGPEQSGDQGLGVRVDGTVTDVLHSPQFFVWILLPTTGVANNRLLF